MRTALKSHVRGLPLLCARAAFLPSSLPNLGAWWNIGNIGSLTPYAALLLNGTTQYVGLTSNLGRLNATAYTVEVAFNLTTTAANQTIISDGESIVTPYAVGTFNFHAYYDNADGHIKVVINNYDTAASVTLDAGAYTLGTLGYLVFTSDGAGPTNVQASLNGGNFVTGNFSKTGVGATTTPVLRIGATIASAAPANWAKNVIDEACFTTVVLTQANVTTLYAGGALTPIESRPASFTAPLHSWKLRETGATARADSGSGTAMNLSAVATPVATTSLVSGQQAQNGDLIKQVNDLSGNGRNLVQTTPGKAATLVTNQFNGRPCLRGSRSLLTSYNFAAVMPTFGDGSSLTFMGSWSPEAAAFTKTWFGGNASTEVECQTDALNPPHLRIIKQNVGTVAMLSSTTLSAGWQTVAYAYTGNSTTGGMWINAVEVSYTTGPTAVGSLTRPIEFGSGNGASQEILMTDWSEAVYYTDIKTLSDLQRLHAYLNR